MLHPTFYSKLWACLATLQPPPILDLRQWADRFRWLSQESSAEPGRWVSARAAYQPDMLASVTDPETEQTVCMTSSQVGKTEVVLNAIGYYTHWDPSPILVVQPTVEMAEAFSKERLAPAIRDSPELAAIFPDPKSRTDGNTISYKKVPGGFVAMVGANAPAGLAMRPVRIAIGDEVDRWPASAGTEGDPANLLWKRTRTFWNRVGLWTSTPTVKGSSRIAGMYEQSTKERFYVPCNACGHAQHLVWAGVKWTDEDPSTARYQCDACDQLWTEPEKMRAVDAGEWIAEHPERGRRVRGFHLNELYSPWSSMADMVQQFLIAKANPETLQTFVNTALAELWEGEGETVDSEHLWNTHRRPYDAIPDECDILTGAVDVQGNRIEGELVAWNSGTRASWSLLYFVIDGDPRLPAGAAGNVWDKLETILYDEYKRDGGGAMRVRSVFVDAGFLFDEVTAWTKRRAARGIYASRGEAGQGKPWLIRKSRNNKARAQVHWLGVDSLKGALYRYLAIDNEAAPGYCTFPNEYEIQYFEQLTAEKVVTQYRYGFPVLVWQLPGGRRNEALDIRAYNMAALERVAPRRLGKLRASKLAGAGNGGDNLTNANANDSDFINARR